MTTAAQAQATTSTIEVRIITVKGRRRGQYRPLRGAGWASLAKWKRMTVPDAKRALQCAEVDALYFHISQDVRVVKHATHGLSVGK